MLTNTQQTGSVSGMTGNQVVGYNLFLARVFRGLTQEQAAEKLEPFLGRRWTKAQFSTAERSVAGKRVRQFDADEILAFARAFDLPVAWFFTPPMPEDPLRRLPSIEPPTDVGKGQLVDAVELIERSTGAGHNVDGRIEPVLQELGPAERDRLTYLLRGEAAAWWRWSRWHAITREQDRETKRQEERGELPPIPREEGES